MYKIIWIRYRDKFHNVSGFNRLKETKETIAKALNKNVTDLRFTEIDYIGILLL